MSSRHQLRPGSSLRRWIRLTHDELEAFEEDDVAAAPPRDGRTLDLNFDTEIDGGRNADVWVAQRDCGE